MANLQVGREDCNANEEINIEFNVKGYEFLVTNLTDDVLYVTLGDTFNENNSVVVPSETSRVVTVNKIHSLRDLINVVSIKPLATASNGVEVQCILW